MKVAEQIAKDAGECLWFGILKFLHCRILHTYTYKRIKSIEVFKYARNLST